MKNPSWDDARVEMLTKLWDDGLSASQIAKALNIGVSRNAVIGKAHRLGLTRRVRPVALKPKRYAAPMPKAKRLEEKAAVAKAPPTPIPPPPISVEGAKTLTLKGACECSWPVGSVEGHALFCCAPVEPGKSYCAGHLRKAYQPGTGGKRLISPDWGRQSGAADHPIWAGLAA